MAGTATASVGERIRCHREGDGERYRRDHFVDERPQADHLEYDEAECECENRLPIGEECAFRNPPTSKKSSGAMNRSKNMSGSSVTSNPVMEERAAPMPICKIGKGSLIGDRRTRILLTTTASSRPETLLEHPLTLRSARAHNPVGLNKKTERLSAAGN